MEYLEDPDAWFLPKKKGHDGKKRQLKKNRKKFLQKNEGLINAIKLLSGEKVTVKARWGEGRPRSITGSCE